MQSQTDSRTATRLRPRSRSWSVMVILLTAGALSAVVICATPKPNAPDGPNAALSGGGTDLSNWSTDELLQQKLSQAVSRELLRRDGVSLQQLQAALQLLAKQQRRPELQVLKQLVVELPKDAPTRDLRNLTQLFARLQIDAAVLRRSLRALLKESHMAARQVAHAALVDLDGTLPTTPQGSPKQQVERLQSVPLVPSNQLHPQLADQLQKIAEAETAERAVRRAAVRSLSQLNLPPKERSYRLTETVQLPTLREASLRAIAEIPPEQWPDDRLGFLAAGIIAWLAELPAHQRYSSRADVARQLAGQLTERLPGDKRKRFEARLAELMPD